MATRSSKSDASPAEQITDYIARHDDWRGTVLAKIRKAFLASDPGVVEEWKWMGSPVWEHNGILAVANAHKGKVKVTFQNGAHLDDPDGLFNAGLEGNQRRAIDLFEGDKISEAALKRLIKEAIKFNLGKRKA